MLSSHSHRFALTLALTAAFALPAVAQPTRSDAPLPSAQQPQSQRGWLGVHMGPTPAENNQGVPVLRSIPDSPADSAGLVRGDIIQAINGAPVRTADALIRALAGATAGSVVTVDLVGPNPRRVDITLDPHPGGRVDFGRRMIGRPLPLMEAGNLETGEREALFAVDGKVRIIELWATWCGPCRAAMPQISRLVSSMDKDRFEFVSVASEDRLTVQAFMKSRSVPYRVLFDEEEEVVAEYWATATPTFILVDQAGTVVEYVQGADRVSQLFQQAQELMNR